MERLKSMKETLMNCVQGQLGHLDSVDTKELGEAIDMIKDLEEAIYYKTITESMEKKGKEESQHYYTEYRPDHYRDVDRGMGRMYYPDGGGYTNGNGGTGYNPSGSNGNSRSYTEREFPLTMRDYREGRSPMSRKMYMESKEMHKDKGAQMKELEKYMHELSEDITEMIKDASPEEKMLLQQKISGLADKIH
jgi:hypothetical protein